MADRLFTQNELNKIVAQRIKRERERLKKEFERRLKRCMASVHLIIYQEMRAMEAKEDAEWEDAIQSEMQATQQAAQNGSDNLL